MWKVRVVKISGWIHCTVQPSLFSCLLTEMHNYVISSSCVQFNLPYRILQHVVYLNLWLSNLTFSIGLFNVASSSVSQASLQILSIFTISNSILNMFIYLLWQYSWASASMVVYFFIFPNVRPKSHLQVIQMMYKDEFLFVC